MNELGMATGATKTPAGESERVTRHFASLRRQQAIWIARYERFAHKVDLCEHTDPNALLWVSPTISIAPPCRKSC